MTQPEALRLAAELEACPSINYKAHAAELRRLQEENDAAHQVGIQQEGDLMKVEAQRDALLEALQALYDEQQGPPLIRHQAAWEAAMDKARAAIKAVEGEKK